ncbi:putative disease resistance RPP13-like protein 1 [Cocos nucifera]|uniref:Putative disease resistance RPP13-like protein 1 n=1 Tax=Cocos nucifera TaxID=13894 RepID=A0A8K0ND43_COCNU|nr:putative disease resistance RPP13-like protein 1 [Cocos nucifera]
MDWHNLLSTAVSIPKFLLSNVPEKVAEWLFSLAQSEYSRISGLEDEIGKLRRTCERIHSLLTDAEERRYIEDDSVKRWLLELKDVAFAADELLDRHQTQLKLFSIHKSHKRKSSWSLPFLGIGHDSVLLQRRTLATQIAKINDRLEEINEHRKNLRLGARDGTRRGQTTASSHLSQSVASYERSHAVGREVERENIVQALRSDCGTVLSVLPIYGAPGIGKTTLAQLVYDDVQVKQDFKWRFWVSLSKGFDVRRVIKEIIEAVRTFTKENQVIIKDLDAGKNCDSSLDALQCQLRGMVSGRKFLLVLDNLWAENFQFWETLRLPLMDGGKESKVLITARSKLVLKGMPTLLCIHLEGLTEDPCAELLLKQAFPNGCSSQHPNLEKISKKIVKRCHGSPLQAKLLGCLLNNETEEDKWEDMLNEVCSLEKDTNGILPSLMISYNHLDYHLKQCFKYCSMFPIDYEFDRDELVKLWMAEGLIQRSRSRSTLEVIGGKYFDNLLWRSFFEVSGNQGQKQKYRMLSLMHDLARLVSNPEGLVVEHDVSYDKPEWVRYSSLFHQNGQETVAFDKLYRYANLRTFKLSAKFREHVKKVPADLFLKLTCLRVLDLSFSDIEELPDSVGDLIHLRYLGLYETKIQSLPESVCWLYNLQTLELGECYKLRELPKGTSYMVNLRHLGLHVDWEKEANSMLSMPQGIGKLTSLQTLSRFIVTSENGCNIGELKDLNLRGELCISKLENVIDAMNANLSGKRIDNLKLQWSKINPTAQQGGSDCGRVIECLRPHIKLKYLWIENYAGSNFPGWLGDSSFSHLETLRLSCCKNCEQLPLIGQLPRLRNLWIKDMHGMRSMGNFVGFQSLEKLTLSDMPNLERLFEVEDGEIPRLHELSILECPQIKELTVHLPMLVKLMTRKCQKLNLPLELTRRDGLILEVDT